MSRVDDLAAKFGAREAIAAPALSPDGRSIVYLSADAAAGTSVMVAPSDGSGAPAIILTTSDAATRVTDCDWADDSRLVCTAYVLTTINGRLAPFVRLLALDRDGKRVQTLAQAPTNRANVLRMSQYDGSIIDWMQGDTGKLLMARDHVPENDIGTRLAHTDDGLGVDLIDTHSLAASPVEPGDPNAVDYLSDGKGVVWMIQPLSIDAAGTAPTASSG